MMNLMEPYNGKSGLIWPLSPCHVDPSFQFMTDPLNIK